MTHFTILITSTLSSMKRTLLTASLLAFSLAANAELTPDLTEIDYGEPDAKVSPNGKYLALALVKDGRRTISVVETKGFKPVGGINFGDWQDAGNFFWVSNKRIVTEILHRHEWDNTPKFYGELYAANYNGKNREMLYGYRAGEQNTGSAIKKREDIFGWAKVISTLPDDERHILISSTLIPDGSNVMNGTLRLNEVDINDLKKLYSTVHRLNVKTGKLHRSVTRSPVTNAQFFTDEKGALKFAAGFDESGNDALYQYVENDWKKVPLPVGAKPAGFDKEYAHAFFLDQQDANQCLAKINLASMEQIGSDMCYEEDPFIALTTDNAMMYGIKGTADELYSIIDDVTEEAIFLASVQSLFQGQDIDIASKSEGGEYYVVKARDAQNTVTFYLYSAETNQFNRVI